MALIVYYLDEATGLYKSPSGAPDIEPPISDEPAYGSEPYGIAPYGDPNG